MLKKMDRWLTIGVWALLIAYLVGRLYYRFVVGVCTDVLNPLLFLAFVLLALNFACAFFLRRQGAKGD